MERNEPASKGSRQAFDRASLPADARGLKTKDQWEEYNEITVRASEARALAEKRLKERFASRVARETKRLMVLGGAKNKDLKYARDKSDNFDPTRLRMHAEQVVQLRHAQRLSRIDMAEARLKFELSRTAIDQALKEAQQRYRAHWREATRGLSR